MGWTQIVKNNGGSSNHSNSGSYDSFWKVSKNDLDYPWDIS